MGKESELSTTKQVDLFCVNAEITGTIVTPNDIRVDGTINGNVKTSGRLVLGQKARIIGNVECREVDCFGYLEGDVQCSGLVALKERAVVKGTITTKQFSVEAGVQFNGSCTMAAGE